MTRPAGRGYKAGMKLFITVAVACALGTMLALFGWNQYQAWSANQVKAQAEAKAAEFAKSPIGIQRAAVSARLNDAASAQWRNERASSRNPTVWCGEVNAKNRMGAMVGFTRYMADIQADRALADMDQVRLEPSDRDRADPRSAWAAFDSRWQMFCQ